MNEKSQHRQAQHKQASSEQVLQDLFEFIWESPSPYHAVSQAHQLLTTANPEIALAPNGPDTNSTDTSSTVHTNTTRTSTAHTDTKSGTSIATLAAANINPDKLHFRIVGAHTDSPNLRIKPQPDSSKAGYQQLVIEPYGGVLLNSWLDRDLGISGRVVTRESETETSTRLLKIDRPLLRVPQLAIHLDREIGKDGLKLASQHMVPIWGLNKTGKTDPSNFRRFLSEQLDISPGEIIAWDLMTHDLTPPAKLGREDEFYAAPRIDNLASCHAGLHALATLSASDLADDAVAVLVLYDHEEVGSETSTGAASPALQHHLERIALSLGADRDQFLAALARSIGVSADGAHAVHPNYLERHDSNHHVHLNGGPVIKLNSNQRYATDANTNAIFQSACQAAGVEFQLYSHQNDLPCGTTIGPITATQLGISVVDVGSPQLSMHSAREFGGAQDPAMLAGALREFLKS